MRGHGTTERERYQRGTLEKKATADGLTWYIRFSVIQPDGTTKRPRFRIGLVADLPTKTRASAAAEHIRKSFNELGQIAAPTWTMADLIDRYIREEIPERYSTAKGYKVLLLNHIAPRWGRYSLNDIKPQLVREWLRSLPLSSKTRSHIRNMMRILFNFAMLWEWMDAAVNPMTLFRIENATKRLKEPTVLTPEQFGALMQHSTMKTEPMRTLVLIAGCLGLRASELFGLQWQDVDWVNQLLHVRRGIVEGHVDHVKTVYSRKPLPLDPGLAEVLKQYRQASAFTEPHNFIFASPFSAGEKPYSPQRLQHYHLREAAKDCGLGSIGWHTFRHTYRSWMSRAGTPIAMQKELMRHAHIATTMNVYGGTFVDELRPANSAVVRMVLQ